MSCENIIFTVGSENILLAYVTRKAPPDVLPIQQADIDSITFAVTLDGVTLPTLTGTLLPADVILDTPLTGEAWKGGASGYNFIHVLPAVAFPTESVEAFAVYNLIKSGLVVGQVPFKGPVVSPCN